MPLLKQMKGQPWNGIQTFSSLCTTNKLLYCKLQEFVSSSLLRAAAEGTRHDSKVFNWLSLSFFRFTLCSKTTTGNREKSSAADTRGCLWRDKEMKHYWQKRRWGQPVLGNSTNKYLNPSCQPPGGFQSLTQSWCLHFPLLKNIGCSPSFLQNKWQPFSSISAPLSILVIFSLSSFMVSAENCSFLAKNYHFNITK